MAEIYVQTEECYRKKGYIDEIERHFINADELVDVLNSAVEDGPDRYYILISESGQAGKALVSGTRNP